jgi:uncharacterized protein
MRTDASTAAARPAPIATSERSEWLDALRGFALLGILLFNIDVLGGYAFLPPEARAQLPWNALDTQLDFLLLTLVQGKFYSLFSFLFGLGFAVQLRRAQAHGVQLAPMFRRRMAWLLVFGLLHATLVWGGDILSVYALFGFALLLFRQVPQRLLLVWALFFLLLPILAYVIFLAVHMPDPFAPDPGAPRSGGLLAKVLAAFSGGSYVEVVEGNTIMYTGGLIRRALRFQLPRVFGMFLLGAWFGRAGLPDARDALRPLMRRLLWWGLALGLPLNIAYVALGGGDALLPATATGLAAVAVSSIGIPLLSLAYVAAFALFWRASRGADDSLVASRLVASGRMPLSNYLGQSLACVALFYGLGLGFFGHLSLGVNVLVALTLFLGLSLLSHAWLRRHARGPMEALWRRLSYGAAARAAD